MQGPTPEETAAGLGTSIPEGTTLNGLSIADGVATVDLSGEFDDGGGSLAMFTRLAQVVHTLTQFPTVEGVLFQLDGVPVETFSSEGIVLDGPQTREDYEDQAPPTLVETPAVGRRRRRARCASAGRPTCSRRPRTTSSWTRPAP